MLATVRGLLTRRSLVFRLLLLSAAAATLPALVISWLHRSISSHVLAQSLERQQTEIAHRIAEDVNDQIHDARSLVALVAQSSFFSAGSRVDQYEALRNLLEKEPAFQETMFVSDSGAELLKVRHEPGIFRLTHRSEDIHVPFVGAPFFAGNRSPTILLGYPVRSFANPRHSGAVLAKMSFTSLGDLLRQVRLGPHGVAYIVDKKGLLLAHPDETLVLGHSNWAAHPVVRTWLAHPERPTALTEAQDPLGTTESVAYPIPLLESAVVIQQPKKEVFAPLEKMLNQFILWTLVSLAVFISLAVWLAWRILHPVRQLTRAAEQLGRGQRDVHLDIHTHDELEDLGTTFVQMASSLRQLEMLRNDLTHMIVHDLKMPLSTMMATLDSLILGDFGALAKGQVQFVQTARRSGQEMLLLIQNLLDVAKMEEGKLKLHKERFPPRGWAENVLSGFQPLADAAQKRLRLSIGPDLGPVEGDIALLSRVLANLISNALRHIRPVTGEVEVSLYADGHYLAVQVRDNGDGIAEEDQKHIFEKFTQGHDESASTRSARTGVGLGLTFCKMMVEAHGGRIAVFSQPNEGSLFTLHLPMQAPYVVPEPPAETPGSIAGLSTDKVG